MNALIILSALGIFALLSDMLGLKKILLPATIIGLLGAMVGTGLEWGKHNEYFQGMLITDNTALVYIELILFAGLVWFLLCGTNIREHLTEHYAILSFGLAGAVVMVSYAHLVMLFLGIEILSIAMYIMAGSSKDNLSSNESALKYFLMGSFSTGFLLFGIALIYGCTGSFSILGIFLSTQGTMVLPHGMLLAGVLLILVSLVFKIAGFPFHFWAPDVYHGAPDSITAFMGSVVKVAATAAFFRLFANAFSSMVNEWSFVLCIIAIGSMLIGNMGAALQDNLKRMLAFSSIAHAGYMLIAIITLNKYSEASLLFYLSAYTVATLASFAIIIRMGEENGNGEVSSLAGLGKRNPLAAATMTIAMLSLAGIPPLSGFFAKYFLFNAALQENYTWLVLAAVAGTLISVYYYFRIIHSMYIVKGSELKMSNTMLQTTVMVVLSALLLLLGIMPDLILKSIGV